MKTVLRYCLVVFAFATLHRFVIYTMACLTVLGGMSGLHGDAGTPEATARRAALDRFARPVELVFEALFSILSWPSPSVTHEPLRQTELNTETIATSLFWGLVPCHLFLLYRPRRQHAEQPTVA